MQAPETAPRMIENSNWKTCRGRDEPAIPKLSTPVWWRTFKLSLDWILLKHSQARPTTPQRRFTSSRRAKPVAARQPRSSDVENEIAKLDPRPLNPKPCAITPKGARAPAPGGSQRRSTRAESWASRRPQLPTATSVVMVVYP